MVVAPKSTLGNWMNEIKRFCPVLRAVKFLGNPDERVSNNLYRLFCFPLLHIVILVQTIPLFYIYRDIYARNYLLPGSLMCVSQALRWLSKRNLLYDDLIGVTS